jgi:hypothetical protein
MLVPSHVCYGRCDVAPLEIRVQAIRLHHARKSCGSWNYTRSFPPALVACYFPRCFSAQGRPLDFKDSSPVLVCFAEMSHYVKRRTEEHYQSLGEVKQEGEDEQQGQQLQALFRRLAIFVAPCRIKAVQEVCVINNDLLEQEEKLQYLLEMLARHFLITYDYENGWIAILHNLLRRFAKRKLQKKEKEENEKEHFEVQRKFMDYYKSLVIDYMDQQFNKEELEITKYLESSNGSFENILYTCKLHCFFAFPDIERRVKKILDEEGNENIQGQLIKYRSEKKTRDLFNIPDEIKNKYNIWYEAVKKVCKQEQQDLITHNPLLALWQDFSIKVQRIDMLNLTELYKVYGLYK